MRTLGLAIIASALAISVAGTAQAQMGPYVTKNLATLKAQPPGGSPFNQALKGEYTALGEEALRESDHQHADWYIRKGYASGAGAEVLPDNPRGWILPKRERGMLYEWYGKLMQVLPGGRTSRPAAAARAQAMYDCWLEEAHEDYWMRDLSAGSRMADNHYQPNDIARCKNAFFCAMYELGVAVPIQCVAPARDIHFEFDRPKGPRGTRADLWRGGPEAGTGGNAPPGAASLDALIGAMRSGPGAVQLKGHTDTVGGRDYNQRLSEWRAVLIQSELARAGIAGPRVTFRGVGKDELAVPTPDQRRRVENRRVSYQILAR